MQQLSYVTPSYMFCDTDELNSYIHSLHPITQGRSRITLDIQGRVSIQAKEIDGVYSKQTQEEQKGFIDSFRMLLRVLSRNAEALDSDSLKIISYVFFRIKKIQHKCNVEELTLPYELLPRVTEWHAGTLDAVKKLTIQFSELRHIQGNVEIAEILCNTILSPSTTVNFKLISEQSAKLKARFLGQYDDEDMAIFYYRDFLQDFLLKKIMTIESEEKGYLFELFIEICKEETIDEVVSTVFFDLYLEFFPEILCKENIDACLSKWDEARHKIIYFECHAFTQAPDLFRLAILRFPSVRFLFYNSQEAEFHFCDADAIVLSQCCKNLKIAELANQKSLTMSGLTSIFENCKQLRALDISGCSGIDIEDSEFFQKITQCNHLEYLVLSVRHEKSFVLASLKKTMSNLEIAFN